MTHWLVNLAFWHWWLVAGFLAMLEYFWPIQLFLWLGIAAAVTGLILMVFPNLSLGTQLVLYPILAAGSVVARRLHRGIPPRSKSRL